MTQKKTATPKVPATIISRYRKNCMGTLSFMAKFAGMRKEQEFIVYPMTEASTTILIQSDTRIGNVDLVTGGILMSASHAGGAYAHHLAFATELGAFSTEELLLLKSNLFSTASGKAGSRGVTVDNKGALEVFEATRAAA